MSSKIIKPGTESKPTVTMEEQSKGAKIIDRDTLVAGETAKKILEEARQTALEIIETARQEAEKIRMEAYDKAFASGLAEWEGRIKELTQKIEDQLNNMTPQIIQLALKIAEKILRAHLDMHPDAILPMVEEALQTTRSYRGDSIIIRVHPDDASALEQGRTRLISLSPAWKDLEIIADETLSRGGCRIETNFGTVDASIETQLRAIENILMGRGG